MQQKDSTAVNAVSVVLETRTTKMQLHFNNPFFLYCVTMMLFFWVISRPDNPL